jgi:hypothetical protein
MRSKTTTAEMIEQQASGQWYQTRWWRVIDPDGELWGESSDGDEMLEAMRPGDTLQQLWAREDKEWRDAPAAYPETHTIGGTPREEINVGS